MEIVSTFCTTFSQFFPGLSVADFLCWALDDAKYARKICSWGQHTGDWWRLGNHLRSIGGAYVKCPKKVVAWFDPDNGQVSHVIDVIFQFYKITSFLGDERPDQVNNFIAFQFVEFCLILHVIIVSQPLGVLVWNYILTSLNDDDASNLEEDQR